MSTTANSLSSNSAFSPSAGSMRSAALDSSSGVSMDEVMAFDAIDAGQRVCSIHSRPTQTAKPLAARLIDLNVNRPDGTVGAVHRLLATLADTMECDLYAGVRDGEGWIYSSSHPHTHRETPLSPEIRSAIAEAAANETGSLMATEAQQSSMILQSVRLATESPIAIGFNASSDHTRIGLVLVTGKYSVAVPNETWACWIRKVRSELTEWLDVWYMAWLGAQSNTFYQGVRRLYRQRKYWAVALCAVACSLVVPMPYWPGRECIVEPAARRFLTSPVAGRVIEAQVRPGDVVQPGQLLAKIDDEAVRWQLANVEAEYQKAAKKHDAALATRASGELRIAQLERQQHAIQIESLQSRLQELEIRSPIAGVVVDGDWVRKAGTAVEKAQTLFEIAPLDTMRVRTLLTSEDLGDIAPGMPVTIRVDAAYGEKWNGTLERIDPRGRVEGSDVVFEAETIVENSSLQLRPGMRGSARMSGGWHSLGWMIFHRPYVWLMKKLAW